MKRAYLVTGAESSGTCYLTRLLIYAGCAGKPGGPQPFDGPGYSIVVPEPKPNLVVVQRSLPHGEQWPDLKGNIGDLRRQGYFVTVLVLARDSFCQEKSHLAAGHSKSHRQFTDTLSLAWREVFAAVLGCTVDFIVVPYHSLGRPEYRKWLAAELGLPGQFEEPFADADTKYYEVA